MGREIAHITFNPVSKRLVVVLAISLAAIASLNLYALPLYPPPSCDDVSYTSTAVSFLERGQFGWSPVFTQGDYAGRDINWTPQGRLYTGGLIGWYWVLGVSLYVGRAFGLLGGFSAALLLYWVGSRFYNRWVGLGAALFFVTTTVVFLSSHLVRPDIWLSAFNLLALLAVHKSLNSPALRWTLLAGLISALAFDIHGHGIATIAASGVTIGVEYGWRTRRIHNCMAFGGGLVLGLAIWVIGHLWPDPAAIWMQVGNILHHTSLSQPQGPASIFNNVLTLGQFVADVYGWNGKPWVIAEALLSLCGLIVALKRRARPDRLLLIWLAASFSTFALIFSQRFISYNSLFNPLLVLLGVSSIDPIARWVAGRLKQPQAAPAVGGLICIGLVATNFTSNIWLTYRYHDNNFVSMGQALETIIPPGASVLADPNWWWALQHNRTFITDEYFLYPLPPFNPPSPNVAAALNYLKPDYVLIDSATSCFDRDGPGHAELQAYVQSSCTLVSTLAGAWVDDPKRAATLLGQTTSIYRCTQP